MTIEMNEGARAEADRKRDSEIAARKKARKSNRAISCELLVIDHAVGGSEESGARCSMLCAPSTPWPRSGSCSPAGAAAWTRIGRKLNEPIARITEIRGSATCSSSAPWPSGRVNGLRQRAARRN